MANHRLSTGSLRKGLTRWDYDDVEKVRHMAKRYEPSFIARYMGMREDQVRTILGSKRRQRSFER